MGLDAERIGDPITTVEEYHALERLTNVLYLIENHDGVPDAVRAYAGIGVISVRLLTRALMERSACKRAFADRPTRRSA